MKHLLDRLFEFLPETRLQPKDGSKIMTLEDVHRRRVIQFFGMGFLLAMVMTLYQLIFVPQTHASFPAMAMTGFACLGCLYGLCIGLWNKHPQNALRMLMVLFLVFTGLTLLFSGGLTKYNVAIVPVLPVMAAMILSPRDAMFLAALHALMVIAIAIVWSASDGSLASLSMHDWHIPVWTSVPILGLFITTMSAVYMTRQNEEAYTQVNNLLAMQEHLAVHDPLSGLGNRIQLRKRLDSSPEGDEFDLLLIDLDGFKAVNDTHGHEAGDFIIETVADRLREVSDERDLVIRLGGDEFVVLLENVDGGPAEVRAYAKQVIEILSRPYPWNSKVIRIGASIGHARYPAHTDQPGAALGLADKALYQAKEAGKGVCATHGTNATAHKKKAKRRFKLASPPHTRFV